MTSRKSKKLHTVGRTVVKLGTISVGKGSGEPSGGRLTGLGDLSGGCYNICAHVLVYVGGLIKDYNEGLTNALWPELLASVCACMARMNVDLKNLRGGVRLLGKIVRPLDFEEVCDAESRYEPLKKGSKADPIVVSDSKEADHDVLEANKRKWDTAFDMMLDEE
ncbi:hypothetical protein FNV43_RR07382 [Rhamnella rubrinervis]|uniref:Uncharacterized protein n=1 Tax=Rhamnella rubrinervis TaxID=2594499 RepID=A0A8K0HEV1_9ROSA|nr:hypothetical protein FNV43_RR07382 [Rhamnella rubrinervis]